VLLNVSDPPEIVIPAAPAPPVPPAPPVAPLPPLAPVRLRPFAERPSPERPIPLWSVKLLKKIFPLPMVKSGFAPPPLTMFPVPPLTVTSAVAETVAVSTMVPRLLANWIVEPGLALACIRQ
jgi:hypothetical protein